MCMGGKPLMGFLYFKAIKKITITEGEFDE
jgi:hypothetical protein